MNFMAASGCITSVITNTSLGVTAARPEPIIYAPSTTSNAEHSFCCCTFRDTDMAHSCSKALFIALALCSVHGLAATIPDVQVSTDTAPASALTATAILAGPTVLGSTGYRKLLQQTADGSNSFSPAEDAMASALQQTITPAVVNTTLIADASALKAMKGGDKAASKRAAIRYYWLIACGDYEGAATGAEAAAQQLAATNEVSQFEDAGVADTRNNLIKASLALAKTKPATEEQCIKYRGTTLSAGYQARSLVGAAASADSVTFWNKAFEIMADDLNKLMPIGTTA